MEPELDLSPDDTILFNANSTPSLLAFSGRAGSGKSVCSSALVDQGWKLVKFADPLKNMLRAFYSTCGLDEVEIERRLEGDLKECPDKYLQFSSPREAMQTLGGEWGRDMLDPCLWTMAWYHRVRRAWDEGFNVVVDDCRYPNEASMVRTMGGSIWFVERPLQTTSVPVHASEEFDFAFDGRIVNGGSLQELIEHAIIKGEVSTSG